MKYSHLLNKNSIKRCIKALTKSLQEDDLLDPYHDAVRSLMAEPGTAKFPGFNMLSPSAPYRLFVPAPTCDISDFLNVYEEFVDRPLGLTTRPGKAAEGVFAGCSEGEKLINFFVDHDQWKSPALILLTAARYLSGEVESFTDSEARMRLGPGILQVTSKGCYSNFRKAVFPCHRVSPHAAATVLGSATTNHPALVAISTLEEADYSNHYIGTALALALHHAEISHDALLEALLESPKAVPKSTWVGPIGRDAAEEILMGQSKNMLSDLYAALVPVSMSSREFRAKFGNHRRSVPGRAIRPDTRSRWLELLH